MQGEIIIIITTTPPHICDGDVNIDRGSGEAEVKYELGYDARAQ